MMKLPTSGNWLITVYECPFCVFTYLKSEFELLGEIARMHGDSLDVATTSEDSYNFTETNADESVICIVLEIKPETTISPVAPLRNGDAIRGYGVKLNTPETLQKVVGQSDQRVKRWDFCSKSAEESQFSKIQAETSLLNCKFIAYLEPVINFYGTRFGA